MNDIKQNIGLT